MLYLSHMKETLTIIILLIAGITYVHYMSNTQEKNLKAYQERQALCESKEYRDQNAHCHQSLID